jgi:hypothetical protein
VALVTGVQDSVSSILPSIHHKMMTNLLRKSTPLVRVAQVAHTSPVTRSSLLHTSEFGFATSRSFNSLNRNNGPFVIKQNYGHAFFSVGTSKDNEGKKSYEELFVENEKLKKEIEELKKTAAKKPGKFMSVISQYGLPFVAWWTTLYGLTGIVIYGAIDSGIVAGGDAIDLIMSLGLDKVVDVQNLNPKYGNLALAVIVNECLEPLRFPIALATIPAVKRAFSKNKKPN